MTYSHHMYFCIYIKFHVKAKLSVLSVLWSCSLFDWQTWGGMLCDSDSDGDGITNGAELGDPDCDWVKGRTPKRTENITHPGKIIPF